MTVHHCEWHLCKCHLWVTPDPFHIMILRLIWPHDLHICSTLTLISLLYFSVQFSSVSRCVWLFATPWTAARQASLSITNSQSPPKPMSIESVMPSSHLILCHPLLLLPSIFPSIRVTFPMSQLLASGGQSIGVSTSTPRTDLQDGLVASPCSPRDSQESSPTPQFKSINSSALSFLFSPTLTSTHDHWKNHSLD